MTNATFMAIVFAGTAAGAFLAPPALEVVLAAEAQAQETMRSEIAYGVYDPQGTFSKTDSISIEHVYVPWLDADLLSLRDVDNYARQRNRSLQVTLEPRSWSPGWDTRPDQLRDDILGGRYDDTIDAACTALGSLESRVTVRWGHEMEDSIEHFPWSGWAPQDYIAAYRYFVDRCRAVAPDLRFMWAPRGSPNLRDYYPGDEYVDAIGLTVLGLQKYDIATRGSSATFAEILRPGYDLVAGYGKPVAVAELGFSGDAAYEKAWREGIRQAHEGFPLVEAMIYFNSVDPNPWPEDLGNPDWRVESDLFE